MFLLLSPTLSLYDAFCYKLLSADSFSYNNCSTMNNLKYMNPWSTHMMFVRQFYYGNRSDVIPFSIWVIIF